MNRESVLRDLVRREPIFGHTVENPVIGNGLGGASGLYFGIGLGSRQLTRGLPVDALTLLLSGEMVKRKLGLGKGYVLIADTNVLTNGFPPGEVGKLARREMGIFEDALSDMGFAGYSIRLSSELEGSHEFSLLLDSIGDSEPYTRLQLAQMAFMEEELGAPLKIGWAMPGARMDERYFDNQFTERFPERHTFVYTVNGRTMNSGRPRAVPYICEDESERILLERGSALSSATDFTIPTGNGMYNHLNGAANTVRGYSRFLNTLARACKSLQRMGYHEGDSHV